MFPFHVKNEINAKVFRKKCNFYKEYYYYVLLYNFKCNLKVILLLLNINKKIYIISQKTKIIMQHRLIIKEQEIYKNKT